MKNEVFWTNPRYKPQTKVKLPKECDYLIVGGGITGISLAYFLKEHNLGSIVVLEKDIVGHGATGRAAGSIVAFGELDLCDMIELFGKDKAADFYHANIFALHLIEGMVKKEKIDCDLELEESLFAEFRTNEFCSIRDELLAVKDLHIKARHLADSDIYGLVQTHAFKEGILFHSGISINPLKLVQNLATAIRKKGVIVAEKTALLSKEKNKAITSKGSIKFSKIIYCQDSFSKSSKVKTYKSTIAVTQRLSKSKLAALHLEKKKIIWDAKKDYEYFKITKDNRLLIGKGMHPMAKGANRLSLHKPHLKEIREFIQRVFPNSGIKLEYAWSGCMGVSNAQLPVIDSKGNVLTLIGPGAQSVAVLISHYLANKLAGRKSSLDELFA